MERLMSDSIICPKCETEIPLSEAISHQAEERLRAEFEAAKATLASEQDAVVAAKDAEIAAKANELIAKEAEIEAATAKARADAVAGAQAKANERVATQLRDLQAQVAEQAERRQEAEDRELALRAQKRELEAERESMKLQFERTLDEERQAIASTAREQSDEKWQMKVRERDLQIEQMNKRIDDLQAAADQKRSGLQGEVLERELEDVLRETFPGDEIDPVKSGKRGADVVQRVRGGRGECGKLLWESKNHKHWSDGWIDKLREDQQAEKADIGIIVTTALPEGVERIAFMRGVWVCDFASAIPLAIALRQQLDAIKQARTIDTNRSRVADDLYSYVCSSEFQHFVTNAVTSALRQKQELDAERTAATRVFKKREVQIEAQLRNLAGLYGGLQAIAGGALQPVAPLELPVGSDDEAGPLALAS
jgi:hypothetical protein